MNKKYILLIAALTLFSGLSFQSCNTVESHLPKGNQIEVMVSRDISTSSFRTPHPKAIYNYILAEIGYDENEAYFADGATVYFSTIGLEVNPTIVTVNLASGSSALTDNLSKRQTEVAQFKADLKQAILVLLQIPMDQQGTNLASSLAYQLEVMKENNFSKLHSVLLITDGIESGTLNFSSCDFSTPNAFAKLSADLNSKVPFGSLGGFDFTLLSSQPFSASNHNEKTKEKIRLSIACQKFWKYHFEKLGAKARIRNNLINI